MDEFSVTASPIENEAGSASPESEFSFGGLQKKLLRLSRRYSKNEHAREDLVQETLLRLFQNAETLVDIDRIDGWASTVMHNLCASKSRKRSTEDKHAPVIACPIEDASVDDVLFQEQLDWNQFIQYSSNFLTESSTAFLRAYIEHGADLESTASALGIAKRSATNSLRRVKRGLVNAALLRILLQPYIAGLSTVLFTWLKKRHDPDFFSRAHFGYRSEDKELSKRSLERARFWLFQCRRMESDLFGFFLASIESLIVYYFHGDMFAYPFVAVLRTLLDEEQKAGRIDDGHGMGILEFLEAYKYVLECNSTTEDFEFARNVLETPGRIPELMEIARGTWQKLANEHYKQCVMRH